ncbi:ribosomal protein S8 [Culex quinquefasciatus]|uniref:Ribosomal protein S8 n=1 Tax=Culex quinquefasciatus TaxID=7176 RepID=B0XFA0_CULQU|nr:ribosomal protein S8 [Culex quinquefasciatus]|eukprot:XP_001868322.1 ribosomal protein S8 [Culex quinquefasciatus]
MLNSRIYLRVHVVLTADVGTVPLQVIHHPTGRGFLVWVISGSVAKLEVEVCLWLKVVVNVRGFGRTGRRLRFYESSSSTLDVCWPSSLPDLDRLAVPMVLMLFWAARAMDQRREAEGGHLVYARKRFGNSDRYNLKEKQVKPKVFVNQNVNVVE